ncbi:methyltransferase domain-containing protein [Roseovarius spongiae]|uniref:Methyltransferase domain-containing protein n=1 Tax=Roseovarius spongiae TaxID=2320272 RepID=A0A3A8AX15_9RHOB|nr:methyltransferase domain-containing protein [Roseovarius spongiae]RKF16958.1 methyltransferase domain-containing protein [Roseovarius spongiae]
MPSLNRIVMQRTSREWLEALDLPSMEAAEISGKHGRRYPFKSYERFRFPKHDICTAPFEDAEGLVRKFDIVLANQVWEHLDRPYAATRNVLRMLRVGGYFWVAVPFFVPYHASPIDCSRWSARGLKNLLIEAGFEARNIRAAQWGNRAAALRNLERDWPPPYRAGRDDLENDADFPICAWALARK